MTLLDELGGAGLTTAAEGCADDRPAEVQSPRKTPRLLRR